MPRILVAATEEALRLLEPAMRTQAELVPALRIDMALQLARSDVDAIVYDPCFDERRKFALLRALRARRARRPVPIICCRTREAASPEAREALETAVRSLGACAVVDMAPLIRHYGSAVAGEILSRLVTSRIAEARETPHAAHA